VAEVVSIRRLLKCRGNHFKLFIDELSLERGRVYAVVGPNGSGKTTFLQILGLLEAPDSGELLLFGHSAGGERDRRRLRRRITLVEERPYLFRGTVAGNLRFGLSVRGVRGRRAGLLTEGILKRLGLAGLENRRVAELSAGQIRRVALARAAVFQPEILLLDEPFASVDREGEAAVKEVVKAILLGGGTVVFTTHIFENAYSLSGEIFSLFEGQLSSFVPENLFTGTLESDGENQWFNIRGGPRIQVVSRSPSPEKIMIKSDEIVVSRSPFDSSARNVLAGLITAASFEGELVRLKVKVEGVAFLVILTRQSYRSLALGLGERVYLTFKATAVRCF